MRNFIYNNSQWLSAGILLTFLSSFGQTYFISIFSGEIRNTFNLSHGDWGSIYGFGTFASAIVMIWAGGLTDIMRVRKLGPIVLFALATSCLFMALNPLVIFITFSYILFEINWARNVHSHFCSCNVSLVC